ncbi:MAG: TylF/MycF family methyltransferase [Betaproteobacteria bacterium]|nr:TylF/MycF family methyltransferase [Betaproteobacteria bacterium]
MNEEFTFTWNNYKPWTTDDEFLRLLSTVKEKTLVDELRLYELYSLVKQCSKLPGNILEVGVYKGGSGTLISQVAKNIGKHVYLADTFKGIVKSSSIDIISDGLFSDTSAESVSNFFTSLNISCHTLLKDIFPDETGHLIPPNETFCLCHVDVDVYLSVKHVAEWVWSKLTLGGMIVFDDYGFKSCPGATKYVNEELSKYPDAMIVHNLNGHAIVFKNFNHAIPHPSRNANNHSAR